MVVHVVLHATEQVRRKVHNGGYAVGCGDGPKAIRTITHQKRQPNTQVRLGRNPPLTCLVLPAKGVAPCRRVRVPCRIRQDFFVFKVRGSPKHRGRLLREQEGGIHDLFLKVTKICKTKSLCVCFLFFNPKYVYPSLPSPLLNSYYADAFADAFLNMRA